MTDQVKDGLLLDEIKDLHNSSEVELCETIKSHRKLFGKFIIMFKRIVRKSIMWFIKPIVNKQNRLNVKISEIMEKLIKYNSNIESNFENNISILEEKNLELEKKVLKLEELNFTFSKLEELDNKISKIEETFKIELSDSEYEFFNKKSYSQSGEDTIISYIFNYLSIDISKIKYLDLGANHAKQMSNTYYFYENGATGVLVEANPSLIHELHFYRHNDVILNNLVSTSSNEELDFYVLSGDGLSTPDKKQAEETCLINSTITIENIVKVKSITVDEIFEKYFGGVAPNFMSIDIEGYDLEIIKSIDLEKYRPLVIVVEAIEYRPYLPINVKVNDVVEYLQTQGYAEYAFTGINSIFIDARYMKKLNQDK